LTTGIIMGMLATGLLLSPFVSSFPFITNVYAQQGAQQDDAEGPAKQVLLVANENKVQIAPNNALHPGGIEYAAMTFNGTIPAPIIAADQGDVVNITIRNDGQTIHSLDFHAGLGPSNVLSGNIDPGQTKHVTLHAENPGVFMYHCGADGLNGVWEHIANGMYGALVVHPQNEEPAKEFYLSFGEIFNTADKGLFVGSEGKTGTFDLTKFATDQPDLVLTNGMAHKYAPGVGETAKIVLNENPEIFKVKPGELTRWYVLNPGPNGGGSEGKTGTFDLTKFATDQPDLVLTNGMAHKYAPGVGEKAKIVLNENPEIFKVKPGELTRWYVLNPGPNGGVSFHFISGMINVRDGANPDKTDYGTQLLNDETWWIPPGSASVIESTFPEAGTYIGVDHNMNHVVRGAALAVVAADNSTAKDHPPGTSVAPKGSASTVADWSKQTPYEQLIATKTGDTTSTAGNATSVQNATLAYAQENTVNMPQGSSNPSATEFFVPSDISVSAGSTVTWTNSDTTIHTVVEGSPQEASAGGEPAFDSSIMAPNSTFEHTFDTAGELLQKVAQVQ
jgi:plastocyanin